VFRRRIGVAEGGIDNDDPFAAGVIDIDVVDADTGPGHDLEFPAGVKKRCVNSGAATGDDGFVVGYALAKLRHRETDADIHLDLGVGPQQFDSGR
jgi:hypothetical protein